MYTSDRAVAAASRSGSRTAAYVVAGAVATIPAFFLLVGFLGWSGATGGVVVLWIIGGLWLLRQRQEDPAWDRRMPTGRR